VAVEEVRWGGWWENRAGCERLCGSGRCVSEVLLVVVEVGRSEH